MRVFVNIALLAALGVFGVQSIAAQMVPKTGTDSPPRRVKFAAQAPVDITLGKFWWDIGLFYPFTGSVSRDAWERDYFNLMNQSTQPDADLSTLAAEALGILDDPDTLLLEPGEGFGSHVLPVFWEVRGSEVWIVGGDRPQVPETFGPITSIQGQPLSAFLAKRIGSTHQSPLRIYASLALTARRPKSFVLEVTSGNRKLSLKSFKDSSELKDPWIEGGWKGMTLLELAKTPYHDWHDLQRVTMLDLRMANWFLLQNHHRQTSSLEYRLVLRGAQAPELPILRLVREHRGQYDNDWDRFAHDSFQYNRMGAYPPPNRVAWVQDRVPCAFVLPPLVLDELLAETLAGWALPPVAQASARTTLYHFTNSLNIRMRLQSWSSSLSDAKHQATYRNGPSLTTEAAKALAAATLINFDHLFGFTPESLQEQVFNRAIEVKKVAKDVPSLVRRSGYITFDVHAPADVITRPLRTDLLEVLASGEANIAPPNPPMVAESAPSLPVYECSDGSLRFLFTSPTRGFKAGQILHRIGTFNASEVLQEVAKSSPVRSDVKDTNFHDYLGLSDHFCSISYAASIKSLPITVSNPESHETQTIEVPCASLIPEKDITCDVPMPPNWNLINASGDGITFTDLVDGLRAGKNYILDCRFYAMIPFNWYDHVWDFPRKLPAAPSVCHVLHTPWVPMAWGEASERDTYSPDNPSPSFHTIGTLGSHPISTQEKTPLPGMLVLLVSGMTASLTEELSWVLKCGLPSNSYIVGLPTRGIMGSRSELFLYCGQGSSIACYNPTISMFFSQMRNFSYQGLPLDVQITESDLLREMKSGSSDPLLSATVRILDSLGKSQPTTGKTSRPQRGSHTVPSRVSRR